MKRKLKKFFTVFSVLICLVSVNLSLFTVGASANVVDQGPYTHRTIGSPVSLSFFSYSFYDQENYSIFNGLINQPNVYFYDDSLNNYKWSGALVEDNGSLDKFYDFTFQDLPSSGADIFLNFSDPTCLDLVRIDSPILFKDSDDLTQHFNFYLGLLDPVNSLLDPIDTFVVSYWYTFCVFEFLDGEQVINTYTVRDSIEINMTYGWYYVPLFNYEVLTPDVLTSYCSFSTSSDNSGEKYCYLQDAGFRLLGAFSESYFFQSISSSANDQLLSYKRMLNDRFRLIYQAESYEENIIFENLSWTDWVVNSVGAFLDFQIIPGLSFAGMLGLLVGMSLFVVFLKIFAGG